MNIKEVVNDPRLWQALTTALLGYFGYEQVSQMAVTPNVDVEIVVPETSVPQHTHPARVSKDWGLVIDAKVERARKKLVDEYHGGD